MSLTKNLEITEYRVHIGNKQYIHFQKRRCDGQSFWVIYDHGLVINYKGEEEYQPQPSSTDVGFKARCWFDSLEKALEVAERKYGSKFFD